MGIGRAPCRYSASPRWCGRTQNRGRDGVTLKRLGFTHSETRSMKRSPTEAAFSFSGITRVVVPHGRTSGGEILPRNASIELTRAKVCGVVLVSAVVLRRRTSSGTTAASSRTYFFFFFFYLVVFFSSPSLIPCVVCHLHDDTGSAASCFRRLILLYLHCGVVIAGPRRRCLRGFRPRRRGAKHARRRGGCRLAAMCVVVAVVSNIFVHNNGAAFGFR